MKIIFQASNGVLNKDLTVCLDEARSPPKIHLRVYNIALLPNFISLMYDPVKNCSVLEISQKF